MRNPVERIPYNLATSKLSAQTEAYLVFKLLNQSRSGQIALDEFYEVYDATLYCWNVPRLEKDWFSDLWRPVRDVLKTIQKAVTSKWFEYTVCKLKQHFWPSITMCLEI